MTTRVTHTYALMEVSEQTYNEIRKLLAEADYNHAIHDDGEGALDMHGLALIKKPPPPPATAHASTSPGPVNCSIRKRFQNETYPRTCPRCTLGPCPFFHNDGSAKSF